MSVPTTTPPAAPAVLPAPAPDAAPSAEQPAAPAPAPEAPKLSTASLTAAIKAQLTGAKPEPETPTPAPGAEPSPDAGSPPDSSTEHPDPAPAPTSEPAPDPDDDSEPLPDAAFPPKAVAALSHARKQKKELKAQLKAQADEIAALRQQLDPQAAPAEATPAPAAGSFAAAPSAAVTAAETAAAEQEQLRNWARKEQRALEHALQNSDDTVALLANLQAAVSKQGITLPETPAAVLEWLDRVRTSAEDALEEARLDVRFLRGQVQQAHAAVWQESRALASEWAPDMGKAGTEAHKRAEAIRAAFPGIEQHPLGPKFMAAAVRGWAVIQAEIEARAKPNGLPNGKPRVNGRPASTTTVTLPAKPGARLPGAPAQVPARPVEGAETSGSIFQRLKAATTEQEREQLKTEWVKAGLAGR